MRVSSFQCYSISSPHNNLSYVDPFIWCIHKSIFHSCFFVKYQVDKLLSERFFSLKNNTFWRFSQLSFLFYCQLLIFLFFNLINIFSFDRSIFTKLMKFYHKLKILNMFHEIKLCNKAISYFDTVPSIWGLKTKSFRFSKNYICVLLN